MIHLYKIKFAAQTTTNGNVNNDASLSTDSEIKTVVVFNFVVVVVTSDNDVVDSAVAVDDSSGVVLTNCCEVDSLVNALRDPVVNESIGIVASRVCVDDNHVHTRFSLIIT